MIQKLKDFIKGLSTMGINFPYAFDPVTKQASVTLLFAYTTFLLTIVSVIALHFKLDLLVATITTMGFWVIAVIFYLIRNLQKAKFDLDDKSFELEGEDDNEKKDN